MVRSLGVRCVDLAATLYSIREGPAYARRRMSRMRGFKTVPRETWLKETGLATSLRQRDVCLQTAQGPDVDVFCAQADCRDAVPDHHHKEGITIKRIIIFLAGGKFCLQFVKTTTTTKTICAS